ncbi:restriction endonuclease [Paracoccus jiaweipingae]|uniref:restriction endonuclease n=1 Tax=unclassified Paracoccus (in: a-proteobacteria) TaxID=2688777 RepID=UPI0037B23344
MAVPTFQMLMLPALRASAEGPRTVSELSTIIADALQLSTEDRSEMISSGRQTLLTNRLSWAVIYLARSGLLNRLQRGLYEVTDRGRAVLANPPEILNRAFLQSVTDKATARPQKPASPDDATPDETIRIAHSQITEALAAELLERLHSAPPAFFEAAITDLLTRMGYGEGDDTARAIGRSGDDGVDGVVNLDPLGVDQVYFQAKRYAPGNPVGSGAMRDFFGALAMQDVTKGIFVTTSHFTASARDTAAKLSRRIVMIDGAELARLMIRHSVGCRVVESFPVSKLDESFFE